VGQNESEESVFGNSCLLFIRFLFKTVFVKRILKWAKDVYLKMKMLY